MCHPPSLLLPSSAKAPLPKTWTITEGECICHRHPGHHFFLLPKTASPALCHSAGEQEGRVAIHATALCNLLLSKDMCSYTGGCAAARRGTKSRGGWGSTTDNGNGDGSGHSFTHLFILQRCIASLLCAAPHPNTVNLAVSKTYTPCLLGVYILKLMEFQIEGSTVKSVKQSIGQGGTARMLAAFC